MLLQEGSPHDQLRRHVPAVGPQVALVDQHVGVGAGFADRLACIGLGDPGPVDRACLQRLDRLRVGLRQDRDVATTLEIGVEPLVSEP